MAPKSPEITYPNKYPFLDFSDFSEQYAQTRTNLWRFLCKLDGMGWMELPRSDSKEELNIESLHKLFFVVSNLCRNQFIPSCFIDPLWSNYWPFLSLRSQLRHILGCNWCGWWYHKISLDLDVTYNMTYNYVFCQQTYHQSTYEFTDNLVIGTSSFCVADSDFDIDIDLTGLRRTDRDSWTWITFFFPLFTPLHGPTFE